MIDKFPTGYVGIIRQVNPDGSEQVELVKADNTRARKADRADDKAKWKDKLPAVDVPL